MINIVNSIFELPARCQCKLSIYKGDLKSVTVFVFIVRGGVKIKEQFNSTTYLLSKFLSVTVKLLFPQCQ